MAQTSFLPTIECAHCGRPVEAERAALTLGELYYHPECAPTCKICGRRMDPADEEHWTFDAAVVSTQIGYSVEPTVYLCCACFEGGLLDERPALD